MQDTTNKPLATIGTPEQALVDTELELTKATIQKMKLGLEINKAIVDYLEQKKKELNNETPEVEIK